MENLDLQEIRGQLDEIDTRLVELFEKRMELCGQVAEFTPKTILTKDERANLVYAVKIAVKNDGMLKIGMYGGCNFN